MSRAPDGLLPIVIGVVGHRHLDVADFPGYRRQISALFVELRRRYPATPLRVISPLAEGADCLMAEEALRHGCDLLVALPMAQADYEQDFPASTDAFRALLAQVPADEVFVVSLPEWVESHRPGDTLSQRDRCYKAAGEFVASHCHVLLALWDGVASDSEVGTAAVVRLKLQGSTSDEIRSQALEALDSGPVFHIKARRRGVIDEGTGEGCWLYPQEADEAMFDLILSRIDRFNSDVAREDIASRSGDSAQSLLPELADRPRTDRAIADIFGCADQLAGSYRRITHRVLRWVLLLAGGLSLTYELYAELLPWRAVPIAYLVIFAAITGVYAWHRRVDAQGRYLDYRAVAEGLRVQFYWRVAGLRDDVCANYLRKQLDELRWIREALRGASALAPSTNPRFDLVVRHWIRGQSEYYRLRASLQEHRHHRIEASSAMFLTVGLAATLSLVVFWNVLEDFHIVHRWIVLVMGFAPIAAALLEAYGEKSGLRTQANQYARFASVFRRAELLADRLATQAPSQHRDSAELELIRELGRESLMENGDWVLLLRERPIVVPKG